MVAAARVTTTRNGPGRTAVVVPAPVLREQGKKGFGEQTVETAH